MARLAALALTLLASTACGRGDEAAPRSVSVTPVAAAAGARFLVCNNGYRPVGAVDFTAEFDGGATHAFTADTVLGQAGCAELGWEGDYPGLARRATVSAVRPPAR